MGTGYTLWGSDQKQKAWAKAVVIEAQKTSSIGKFIGMGPNNIVEQKTDIRKRRGDRVYFDLFVELSNVVTGNSELTGNEESITSYTDDVLIDRTRNAFKVYDLDKYYSEKDMLSIGRQVLTQWAASVMDEYSIKWLCGNTSLAWPETVTTYATTRVGFGGDGTGSTWVGTDDLGTADTFGINEIVFAKHKIVQLDPKCRPLMIDGAERWVLFIHPRQEFTLKKDSNWLSAQRTGGYRGPDNPLFTGMLGEYDGVILYCDEHLLTGDSNTNARAVIAGQQAMMMAMGEGPKATYEVSDHDNRHSVGIDIKWGLKRAVYNSKDFASFVVDTYASSPSTPDS